MTQLQLSDGSMVRAHMFGQSEKHEKLVLTEEEEAMIKSVRSSWSAILSLSNIDDGTDFFKSGAGSMDVTRYVCVRVWLCMFLCVWMDHISHSPPPPPPLSRLVEEVKDATEVELETDDVYMYPSFEEFTRQVVLKSRGGEDSGFEYHPVRHT